MTADPAPAAIEDAAHALAEVLRDENAALAALCFAQTAGLAAAKDRAIAAFRRAREGSRGGMPGPLALELSRLAAENKRLLERAIYVQGQVIACIARAAPKPAPGARSYGRTGALTGAGRAAPMALAARI
jgi:hypothetical protein